jgi:hypothetical protein
VSRPTATKPVDRLELILSRFLATTGEQGDGAKRVEGSEADEPAFHRRIELPLLQQGKLFAKREQCRFDVSSDRP